MTSHEPHDTGTATTCYRHSSRSTGVICQRCDRHICTECMHQASVGVHCPECVSQGKQKVYTRTTMPGAQAMVTNAIIALNVAAFALQVVVYDARASSDGSTAENLATNGFFIDQGGEWWRVITGGFLHFGVIHLGMNMYSLYRIGPFLEQRLGPVKFGLAYMTSLIGGSFGALLLEPRAFTMGASGAIFGLLGLLVMAFRDRGIGIQQSGLGPVLMINLFISFSGFVSLGGHAGGFIVGGLLGVMYFGANPGEAPLFGRNQTKPDIATAVLGVVLFAACLWAATRWSVGL